MTNQIESTTINSKPLGIILSALYFAIANGLLSVIASVPLLFMSGFSVPVWVSLIGIFTLAVGVLSFATCYGLWILIEWGRQLGIAICAISILLSPISLIMQKTTSGSVLLVIVSVALDALIIWYLLKDDVKSLFSEANAIQTN